MSGSNAYSPARDLTARQPAAGPGMSAQLLFIRCGHKGNRAGSMFIGRLPMWCAACVKEKP